VAAKHVFVQCAVLPLTLRGPLFTYLRLAVFVVQLK
jgi:hypothetical protein